MSSAWPLTWLQAPGKRRRRIRRSGGLYDQFRAALAPERARRRKEAASLPERRAARSAAAAVRNIMKPFVDVGGAGKSVWEFMGISRKNFLAYLESKFENGISWENYGEWHVHHVIPPGVGGRYVFTLGEIVKYTNLRPAWAPGKEQRACA